MKVLNPNNANHSLKLIPRFTPNVNMVFELKNETTKVVEILNILYIFDNGILTINFNYSFVNKSNFQIKLTQNNEVLFRGKLFITDQTNLQDYECRSN